VSATRASQSRVEPLALSPESVSFSG
jgi:hypothetical protein